MKYPALNELNTSREMTDVFRGYNHNLRIGDGEFYEMTNLTSDSYPVLSPRRKRGTYVSLEKPQGIIAKDALFYVDGDTLYKNENPVRDSQMKLQTECDTCPLKGSCGNYKAGSKLCKKTLVSMGAYIIILPDKKYYNTEKETDFGDIEASFTTTAATQIQFCKADGTSYGEWRVSETVPKDITEDGSLWLDTSSTPRVLKIYSAVSGEWSSVSPVFTKIFSDGIGNNFEVGDGVVISGIEDPDLKYLNSEMVIYAKSASYIVVEGMPPKSITLSNPITLTRQMPNMDFVIESENRLWGCRYGVARNGEVVNEIYASKLGDFKNWNCFAGISTDSYVASVGTDGQFTGAITHLGYPLFFKENCIHKVYGNYPANYQIQTTNCRGVQKGSAKSLAMVNETLFYKSRSAVCAYDGSFPQEVSSALGDLTYGNAVAGALGNKYYISMQGADNQYNLFVFDTAKGMWHREDDTQAVEFCNTRGELYFIDYKDNQIKTVLGSGDLIEDSVPWEAVTGILGTDSPDKKYISRVDVRVSLDIGTRLSFFIEYDSSGDWEHVYTMEGTTLRTFAIPIRPKRCDHMRLKITGQGEAKIYSICKTIEQGSDV